MAGKRVTKDITTGIGTFSFPRVFASTKGQKESDGSDQYDIQFLIPKSQREDVLAILRAVKEVGEAEFGANWKKVRQPLRDGDKEAENLATDGQTNGEKYPERLGCYFMNARSSKPVGVYDRRLNIIDNPDDLYGGSKGKISVTFYPYKNNGNTGIGVSLNGVQKILDGESFGGGKPAVETMFSMLAEDDDDLDLDTEVDETPVAAPPAAKKTAAKKTAAKKAAAPVAAEPVALEEDDESDLLGEDDESDAGDMYDDI